MRFIPVMSNRYIPTAEYFERHCLTFKGLMDCISHLRFEGKNQEFLFEFEGLAVPELILNHQYSGEQAYILLQSWINYHGDRPKAKRLKKGDRVLTMYGLGYVKGFEDIGRDGRWIIKLDGGLSERGSNNCIYLGPELVLKNYKRVNND